MKPADVSLYDWVLLGLEKRPSSQEIRDASNELRTIARTSGPRSYTRRWSELLSEPQDTIGEGLTQNYWTPEILRRIMYRSEPGMALVPKGDPCRIVILNGAELKSALVIRCKFEVKELFGLPGEARLFVLDRGTCCILELNLGSRQIEAVEEAGIELSSHLQVHEVGIEAVCERCFALDLPLARMPSQFVVGRIPTSLRRERILLWSSGGDSIYTTSLPDRGPEVRRPIHPRRQNSARFDASALHHPVELPVTELNLAESIGTSIEIGSVALSECAQFVWLTDRNSARVFEVIFSESTLQGTRILNLETTHASPNTRTSQLIASMSTYAVQKDFAGSVIATFTHLADKFRDGSSLPNAQKEAIRASLGARKLFVFSTQCPTTISVVSRSEDPTLPRGASRLELAILPGNWKLPPEGLQVVQGPGEALIAWSALDENFIEVDPQFSLRATLFSAIHDERRGVQLPQTREVPRS